MNTSHMIPSSLGADPGWLGIGRLSLAGLGLAGLAACMGWPAAGWAWAGPAGQLTGWLGLAGWAGSLPGWACRLLAGPGPSQLAGRPGLPNPAFFSSSFFRLFYFGRVLMGANP